RSCTGSCRAGSPAVRPSDPATSHTLGPDMPLTVRALFEHHRESLALSWIGSDAGSDRPAASTSTEPAELIGYLNLIHPNRIHVYGPAERAYTARRDTDCREQLL